MLKRKVLYIDNEESARDTYSQDFQDIFGDEVKIEAIEPDRLLGDMLDSLIRFSGLAALILDERLSDGGVTEYKGIELAEAVRGTSSKLPIYILTNYPDDIVDGGFNVEYVFNKEHLPKSDYQKELSARVRRHLNIYNDILSERETRFSELLNKYVDGTLSKEEQEEFKKLDFERTKPEIRYESHSTAELSDKLDEQEKILKEIQKEMKNND